MAEQKAEKSGKGMFDKKNVPTHRVSDMFGNAVKCKQFLPFLQRAGRMSGLVEFVASGSRFRVYIPRETCIITFLLGGISCPKGARMMPSGDRMPAEPFGEEASLWVKEQVLQREVEIEVESMDKAGNFIGYLFVDNNNMNINLVQEGFATCHFTADRSAYGNQIKNAEDNAKKEKKVLRLATSRPTGPRTVTRSRTLKITPRRRRRECGPTTQRLMRNLLRSRWKSST